MRTHAEFLIAVFGEEKVEEIFSDPPEKEPETAFCCGKLIDKYEDTCPHCGGNPLPF
jgi:hypothetical protein